MINIQYLQQSSCPTKALRDALMVKLKANIKTYINVIFANGF